MSLIGSVIMYFASLEIWVSKDKKKNVVALFILGSMTHTLFCAAWTSLEPLFFIFLSAIIFLILAENLKRLLWTMWVSKYISK